MKTTGYILIGENTKTKNCTEYHCNYIDDIPVSFIKSFSKFTLKPGAAVFHNSRSRTYIIPLSGGIEIDQNNVLVSGEYWILNKSEKVLKNASPDFETTFITIELSLPQNATSEISQILVNPENIGNSLEPGFGLFSYREEGNFQFKNHSDCFIHVISGNFEMEERFVNQEDSLILENINTLEFECLTQQGLFLLFKI